MIAIFRDFKYLSLSPHSTPYQTIPCYTPLFPVILYLLIPFSPITPNIQPLSSPHSCLPITTSEHNTTFPFISLSSTLPIPSSLHPSIPPLHSPHPLSLHLLPHHNHRHHTISHLRFFPHRTPQHCVNPFHLPLTPITVTSSLPHSLYFHCPLPFTSLHYTDNCTPTPNPSTIPPKAPPPTSHFPLPLIVHFPFLYFHHPLPFSFTHASPPSWASRTPAPTASESGDATYSRWGVASGVTTAASVTPPLPPSTVS